MGVDLQRAASKSGFMNLQTDSRNFPRKRSNCEEYGGFRTSITKRQLPVTKPLWEKQLPMIE